MITAIAITPAKCTLSPRPAALRCVSARAQKDKTTTDRDISRIVDGAKTLEGKGVANYGSTLAEEAESTLEPRVAELRNSQLSDGLTKREDIMAFSGPLPELVNGRLAMLGFTACMAAELYSHKTLSEQIQMAPQPILFAFATLIIASVIPVVRGTNMFPAESREGGFKSGFTVTNELINGRAAMIGFALIAIYEVVKGVPLFPAA